MSKENILDKVKKEELEILKYLDSICEKNNLTYFLIGGTLLGAVRHKGFIPWDDDIDVAMPRKDYKKLIRLLKKDNSQYIMDCYKTNHSFWLPIVKIRKKNTEYVEPFLKEYKGPQGIWIDIFPLDNGIKEGLFIHKIQEFFIKKLKGLLYIKNIRCIYNQEEFYKKMIIRIVKLIPNWFYHFAINCCMQLTNFWPNSKYYINFGSQYGIKKQFHLKEKYSKGEMGEFEKETFNIPKDSKYVLQKIYGSNYMELPPVEKRITHNPIKVRLEDGETIIF